MVHESNEQEQYALYTPGTVVFFTRADVGFVPMVCVSVSGDDVTLCECVERSYRIFKQADGGQSLVVRFSSGTIFPLTAAARGILAPIGVGDIVAARCDPESIVYSYGVVSELLHDSQQLVVDVGDVERNECVTVHRHDVVLIDSRAVLEMLDCHQPLGEDVDVAVGVSMRDALSQVDFASLVQDCQSNVSSGRSQCLVLSPCSDNGMMCISIPTMPTSLLSSRHVHSMQSTMCRCIMRWRLATANFKNAIGCYTG